MSADEGNSAYFDHIKKMYKYYSETVLSEIGFNQDFSMLMLHTHVNVVQVSGSIFYVYTIFNSLITLRIIL